MAGKRLEVLYKEGKLSTKKILIVSTISVALMALVDGVLNPGFGTKSLIKVLLFMVVPLTVGGFTKNKESISLFRPSEKKAIGITILLGSVVYMAIIGVYLLVSPYMDLGEIRINLQNDLGVNRDNFLFVAVYISFVNSLLEEFFFRGYLFLGLLKRTNRWKAYTLSAFLFALYHVAIIGGWFSPPLFILAMTGLFVGAIIFNFLNEKNENILNSWIVHMMANLAINTVGLSMFGII